MKRNPSHSPLAVRTQRISRQLTQRDLAIKINELLKNNNIEDLKVSPSQVASWESGALNLDMVRGLSLVGALHTSLASLLPEELLELGALESYLIKMGSTSDALKYLADIEERSDRLLVSSTFPSSFHTANMSISRGNQNKSISELEYKQKLKQMRLEKFEKGGKINTEAYSFSSLLNFVFSPISEYSTHQKIEILGLVIEFFSTGKHRLFFFSKGKDTSDIEVMTDNGIIVWATPVPHWFLEFRNPLITKELLDGFWSVDKIGTEKSLLLLVVLSDILKASKNNDISHQIKSLYLNERLSELREFKSWMIENIAIENV